MKKEFYIGQPLIIEDTGEKVTFVYDDGHVGKSCSVLAKNSGQTYIDFYEYEQLEPSTEFKFSEIIAGLEQGYFDVGTEFIRPHNRKITLKHRSEGLYIHWCNGMSLTPIDIDSTWTLDEPRKEMTLKEIEDELGYKIKLKENSDKPLPMDWI